MTCHALREAIVERARGEIAGVGTRAAVDAHLEYCECCASLMEREQQLSTGLRALAATAADAPPALERRLVHLFAERQGAQTAHQDARASRPEIARWLTAAAAVLVTAGMVAWWWGAGYGSATQNVRPFPPVDTDARAADPTRTPAGPRAPERSDARVTPAVGIVRPTPRSRRPLRRIPPVVRAAGFLALPGAAGLPDFESGQIIRIEIPLSSLPEYGIEIQPDAQGTPVEVDLLVGQDGQARGIRLVAIGAAR